MTATLKNNPYSVLSVNNNNNNNNNNNVHKEPNQIEETIHQRKINYDYILKKAGYSSKSETIFTKKTSLEIQTEYDSFIGFIKESLKDFLETSKDVNFKSYQVPGLDKVDQDYLNLVSERYEIYNSPGKKFTFEELMRINNDQIQKKKKRYHFDKMNPKKIKKLLKNRLDGLEQC